MIDPSQLRQNTEAVAANLARRGYHLDLESFAAMETRRKALQVETEQLQAKRNTQAKAIGQAKARGDDVTELLEASAEIGRSIKDKSQALDELQHKLDELMLNMPNLVHEGVPDGADEASNVIVRQVGTIREFDFQPRDHVDIGERFEGMNFADAAKIAGSRFVVLAGALARLHRALSQFMLDMHTADHGYREVYVPYMVLSEAMQGTGQLPKFADDAFEIQGDHQRFLIPTAEVPVTNLVAGDILDAGELPLKFVAHTPCFRSEAGAYGKDTRGMIRQHQFDKVELVQIVRPDQADQAFESLTTHAEAVLKALDLPYQVSALCAGDLGFSAHRTYDLEVWFPGQQAYREISSCSHFSDFQARRMKARWRNPETNKPQWVHTINGSGLAVGRALAAVLENHQNADGSVTIPDPLRPYMGGQVLISVDG